MNINFMNRKINKPFKLITTIALLWIIVYLLITIISQQIKIVSLNKQCSEIETKIEETKQYTQELESTKTIIDTPEYKEKIAREKLGFLKADEKIFIDSSVR